MSASSGTKIRVGFIGTGGVTAYHHLPGLRLDPRAELTAICDTDAELVKRRQEEWQVAEATTDPEALCASDIVDAVVIATPNDTHRPITLAAAKGGKHIMCEKPLGLSAAEVRAMYEAARDAGVVHMAAFTYRFAPSMRYLRHLLKSGALGSPRHFRSQRFLDWPESSWGWRQYRARAGAGDLFDMTIHRIDFAIDLLGPIAGCVAQSPGLRPAIAPPTAGRALRRTLTTGRV